MQVVHSISQTSHVFVAVLAYFPAGHVSRQEVPSRYLAPVHVRHWLLAAPVQVAHSPWQGSQVLVDEFSKTLLATHAVGQVVPSRYLPLGQLEHWVDAAPVHSEHVV